MKNCFVAPSPLVSLKPRICQNVTWLPSFVLAPVPHASLDIPESHNDLDCVKNDARHVSDCFIREENIKTTNTLNNTLSISEECLFQFRGTFPQGVLSRRRRENTPCSGQRA